MTGPNGSEQVEPNKNSVNIELSSDHMKKAEKKGMRTLGLIGGTSWHSTIEYYRNINQLVNDHFGNNTNPPLLVYTLNQSAIHRYQTASQWDIVAQLLTDAAISLQRAGAEAVMFCANTPHKVYDEVRQKLDIPIIHIAEATAKVIQDKGISKVCFIGTKFSMEEDFLTRIIADKEIEVLVPVDKDVIEELHRIIHEELTFGKIISKSKQYVLNTLQSMIELGAEGVVLGCTEFPLMISQEDLSVPVFNTTEIHSKAARDYILMLDH